VDDNELLKAIYRAIAWDKLYDAAPAASREQVEKLFQRLTRSLDEAAPPTDTRAEGNMKKIPKDTRKAVLYCDGASSGNPGPAGIGMVLCAPDGTELQAWGEPIGEATNNVAEYRAMIAGVERALEAGIKEVEVRSDSELLVKQLTGEYKVKAAGLKGLHAEALMLLGQLDEWTARAIPRAQNKRADGLAVAARKKKKT